MDTTTFCADNTEYATNGYHPAAIDFIPGLRIGYMTTPGVIGLIPNPRAGPGNPALEIVGSPGDWGATVPATRTKERETLRAHFLVQS